MVSKQNIIDIKDIDPDFIFIGLKELHGYFYLEQSRQAWSCLLADQFDVALTLSQTLLDKTWEKLNIGYWKDVDILWRKLYSFVSLIKCYSLHRLGCYHEAMVTCDMGLLMGAPIFNNILTKLASYLTKTCEKNVGSAEPLAKKSKKLLDDIPIVFDISKIENRIQEKYTIEKIDPPSLIAFQEKHIHPEVPVVVQNSFNHWPAMESNRWTIGYLKAVAGSRTVPVEIGEKYTCDNWTQKLMTVNAFIDKFILQKSNLGYLAQHQLFEQIPELKDDIMIPDYCFLSSEETEESDDVLIHAWFGPKGTVSPLHHDPYHNFLAQVVGSKYIRLYDRRHSELVYPNHNTMLDNTSQVDVENIDAERFPEFLNAPYFECILEEGEMLYIPPKWWHYVKSLAISFSVSFWWK